MKINTNYHKSAHDAIKKVKWNIKRMGCVYRLEGILTVRDSLIRVFHLITGILIPVNGFLTPAYGFLALNGFYTPIHALPYIRSSIKTKKPYNKQHLLYDLHIILFFCFSRHSLSNRLLRYLIIQPRKLLSIT